MKIARRYLPRFSPMTWIIGGVVLGVPWALGLYLTYAAKVLGLFGLEFPK